MAHTEETTKTIGYMALSTTETTPETNSKMFYGSAAVDVPPPTVQGGEYCSGKKMKMMRMKKRGLLLCCSNVHFEKEEEAEKALAFLKGGDGNRKLRMLMCCSNIQVGNIDQFVPNKIGK